MQLVRLAVLLPPHPESSAKCRRSRPSSAHVRLGNTRPPHQKRHSQPGLVHRRLPPRERRAVVADEDHQRLPRLPRPLQRRQQQPHTGVEPRHRVQIVGRPLPLLSVIHPLPVEERLGRRRHRPLRNPFHLRAEVPLPRLALGEGVRIRKIHHQEERRVLLHERRPAAPPSAPAASRSPSAGSPTGTSPSGSTCSLPMIPVR